MGGTQLPAKIFIDGDSNMVDCWIFGIGSYSTGQTTIADLNPDTYNNSIKIKRKPKQIKKKNKNQTKN